MVEHGKNRGFSHVFIAIVLVSLLYIGYNMFVKHFDAFVVNVIGRNCLISDVNCNVEKPGSLIRSVKESLSALSRNFDLRVTENNSDKIIPETELEDLYFAVKTSQKFHKTRIKVLIETWISLLPNQTYIFTDSEDKQISSFLPETKEIIRYYHILGYSHHTIWHLLKERHSKILGFEYLKRKVIPRLGLNNRRGFDKLSSFDHIVLAVQNERSLKPGSSLAEIFFRLRTHYGLIVRRDLVQEILQVIDPAGVHQRRLSRLKRRQYSSKGPNWVWHVDQYDKLSPYGIHISGCIDGFSRYIIWLKAGISNKDPKKIAAYYMDSVKFLSAVPNSIRADAGTENVLVAAIQNNLREDHADSMANNSVLFGKSTHNQRIERFWGILRQKCTDRWIDHFKILQREGLFVCGNKLHQHLAQFCYLAIIRRELEETRESWNHHRIRKQTIGDVVSGIPDILYHNPELLGNSDCKNFSHSVETNSEKFMFLRSQVDPNNDIDEDFRSVAEEMCHLYDLPVQPQTPSQAKQLYQNLKMHMERLLY